MMDDTATMILLVEQRWQTLQDLLRMSLEQSDLIQQGRISELLQHLSDKQKSLQQFTQLQEQLRPFALQTPDQREWPSEAQREKCRQQLAESDEMLAEMIHLENDCETALLASRDQLSERMKQSVGSQHAASTYRKLADPGDIRHLDLSSDD